MVVMVVKSSSYAADVALQGLAEAERPTEGQRQRSIVNSIKSLLK